MLFRMTLIITVLLLVTGSGCALLDPTVPGDQGTIAFRISRAEADRYARTGMESFAAALAVADSIGVDVYPPSGDRPEKSVAAGIPAGDSSVQIEISVVAQNNKRVSVKLYSAGVIQFWGVDEDVDVVAGGNTPVNISANPFAMSALSVVPSRVWHNEDFEMTWSPIAAADDYRVQISTAPDFSSIAWEGSITDTMVTGPLPEGDYYFRVRATNAYAQSAWRMRLLHVGGAPLLSGISSAEVVRGETVDFDVFGVDLDHASTEITVFGQKATVLGGSPTQISARITAPKDAFSDVVTVTNNFGSDVSTGRIAVQSIAYIMGPVNTGDWTSANGFKNIVTSYGALIDHAGVAIIPYDLATFISDYDVFDVIAIGGDTGTTASNWAGGGVLAGNLGGAIAASPASVIGVGRGGSAYFELEGLVIGAQNAQVNLQNTIVCRNQGADVYNAPNALGVSDGETMTIHQNTVARLVSVSIPLVPLPAGVTVYASRTITATVFPLVEEVQQVSGRDKTNLLWGFEADPTTMTPVGFGLFQNTVTYLYNGSARFQP